MNRRRIIALLAAVGAILPGAGPALAEEADEDREVRVWVSADDEGSRVHRIVDDGRSYVYVQGDELEMTSAWDRRRGYLGVHLVEMTPDLRRHFRAPEDAGVLVSRVVDGSPAAEAGIAVGDVIVAIEDEEVSSAWDVKRIVAPLEKGEAVAVDLVRDGRAERIVAEVAEREAAVVDLGSFFRTGSDGRTIVVRPEIDPEALARRAARLGEAGAHGAHLDEALERALETLEDPEIRRQIEIEVDERGEMERRLRTMEERLRELERRLEDDER